MSKNPNSAPAIHSDRFKFGAFIAPFHPPGVDPTFALERDLQLIESLDEFGFEEAWIGEHHSAGWEIIPSPEIFVAIASQRTSHIRLGTGVISLPYHHPMMVADRMVFLDHLTRGRVLFGVGPGALVTDAMMLGIDPNTQRTRMEEATEAILRLLTQTEPVSIETDWFRLVNARQQLRPFTQPHMPMVVAASGSPSGMILAGKFGLGVLSLSLPSSETNLANFWKIAEDTAAAHGRTVSRSEWRLVMPVHVAETREEAFAQVREGGAAFWRDYFEGVLGFPRPFESARDKIADGMHERNAWCIGTPQDLIEAITRLQRLSGGFGGLMVMCIDWANHERVLRSFELIARYVKPHFQGSLVNLAASQEEAQRRAEEVRVLRDGALSLAQRSYLAAQSPEDNTQT